MLETIFTFDIKTEYGQETACWRAKAPLMTTGISVGLSVGPSGATYGTVRAVRYWIDRQAQHVHLDALWMRRGTQDNVLATLRAEGWDLPEYEDPDLSSPSPHRR